MLTPEQLAVEAKLQSIFFPYAAGRRADISKRNGRFVHYTSATNALSIIKSKRIWMRNTTCMTDYREVQHGFEALNRYFRTHKDTFNGALNECSAGVAEEAISLFDQWWLNTQIHTYITSISEHDESEDLHGRLSMWRAFGGDAVARVALVFKLPLDIGFASALRAVISPVAYFNDEQVAEELNTIVVNVKENLDFLRGVDRNMIVGSIFYMLVSGVVCLKHEGFREEREWRIMHAPKREPSGLIESSIEVVGGVPQSVYKIPLEDNPDAELGMDKLFDRLIIGPSRFPVVMHDAFVTALENAGIKDASARVFVSAIPVRT